MMKAIRLAACSILFAVLQVAANCSATALAATPQTFVSGAGNDSNPCTREAPCRTFTHVIAQSDAGGEIVVLDSAEYGPISIDRNIAIEASKGVYARIDMTSGGIGVDISPNATRVSLRGLKINSKGGTVNTGISFKSAGTLYVEDCILEGSQGLTLKAFGIAVSNGDPLTSNAGSVYVKNTAIRNWNVGINADGFYAPNDKFGLGAEITLEQVRLECNDVGLQVRQRHKATIHDSVISGNGTGLSVFAGDFHSAKIVIERCVVAFSAGNGVETFGSDPNYPGVVVLSNSMVVNNSTGTHRGPGGSLFSRGNNTIEGNGTNIVGSLQTETGK
ncbi:MAG TPA: right-handed parallel beta-helix repeat-containing protein [Blastocatellia bacterium]|nr:right-handed parallel beta-helix repeat-containing protein [Blastocatellia bacterium]